MIEGQKILITGCAGSIGSELARQLVGKNEIYGIDIAETPFFDLVEELGIKGRVGDIADPRVFEDMVQDFGFPNLIFHAAAKKHVTPMELNPEEAVHANIGGTLNVLRFAKKKPIKVIFISTDKAATADTIMGCSKRFCEIMVRNAGHVSVRFGNVLGSQGSVLPLWQRQIDQGRAVTVTDERMERFFMTIEEACNLVITAAERGNGGEIFILDMGKPIRILDLAKRIIAESRKDVPIEVIGIRPGEQLSEILMTPAEEARASREFESDRFFIIKQ